MSHTVGYEKSRPCYIKEAKSIKTPDEPFTAKLLYALRYLVEILTALILHIFIALIYRLPNPNPNPPLLHPTYHYYHHIYCTPPTITTNSTTRHRHHYHYYYHSYHYYCCYCYFSPPLPPTTSNLSPPPPSAPHHIATPTTSTCATTHLPPPPPPANHNTASIISMTSFHSFNSTRLLPFFPILRLCRPIAQQPNGI
jgi:hypothetical protein